jgi:hypothetical protein
MKKYNKKWIIKLYKALLILNKYDNVYICNNISEYSDII